MGDDDLSVQGEEEMPLPLLIKRECPFLRIVAVSLTPLDTMQRAKHPVTGVTQCLRVCIQGLPLQKRVKWQNPLAWCVAHSLRRAGLAASVKRSKLTLHK